jgi:hypothetical protein
MKASQALSGEIVLGQLLTKLMQIVIENAGAETGFLILEKANQLLIEASGRVEQQEITVEQATPVETSQQLPVSVINYVARTQEMLYSTMPLRKEYLVPIPTSFSINPNRFYVHRLFTKESSSAFFI